MLLLVGLGNPGERYVGNRHNIGFMVVQEIAKRHGIGPWRRRFQGVACEGPIAGVRTLLLLPGDFMNVSGRAVQAAAQHYRLTLDQITVFHDEIELHPAYVKVKVGGGNAGHNGLRSISSLVGNDYRRVGIGVGRPSFGEAVDHYVLRNFEFDERDWVFAVVSGIADEVALLLEGENEGFESKVRDDMFARGFGGMLSHRSPRPKRS